MSNIPGAFAKSAQCPCCKNPWNQDVSGSELRACEPCLANDKGYFGIDPNNFDPSTNLKENFFMATNGGWMRNNPIPGEYPSWNTFIALRDMNLDRLKTILDELSNSSELTEEHKKLAKFYTSFMDESTIEARGIDWMSAIFESCVAAQNNPALEIGRLHSLFGVNALFRLVSSPDKKNSNMTLGCLYQGGLGLPDRDYYFDEDKAAKRVAYEKYVQAMFEMLGQQGVAAYSTAQSCVTAASLVLAFERQLAASHLTRTASRDPEVTYNKMTVSRLTSLCAGPLSWASYLAQGVDAARGFDWALYFDTIKKPIESLGEINVAMVEAMKKASELCSSPENRSAFTHYLMFHAINSYAPNLSSQYSTAHFNFNDKELKGTAVQQVRWKRGLQLLEDSLGEALGQLYVHKYFPSAYKASALTIVMAVKDALRERLQELDWMSASTKLEALKKMEKFKVKIGFPDVWVDYSALQLTQGEHIANIIASRQFSFGLELQRMNEVTDRARWLMTPQTVNAYYHPSLNEIVFPAAILQPPFFDANADLGVQFGSLGAVIGHEMTHGFDDQGRKYDSEGNLRDWWTREDGHEYERRAAVMKSQAEQHEVHGVKLNGKLTMGENIADLGGIKLSLRALRAHLAAQSAPAPLIDGFTPVQRLFLAWSQNWRENITKERALQLVTIDPHGPNDFRCNCPLSNVDDFIEAFGIESGDAMFKPAAERVNIW